MTQSLNVVVCMSVFMSVCLSELWGYLKIGDSCDLEIFYGLFAKFGTPLFYFFFNIARFTRIKGIKRLGQMLLKTPFRNIWEQTGENKLYLVWRYKSIEIKFASERSSKQGIKGLKLISFAKNHYSALLMSKSWK